MIPVAAVARGATLIEKHFTLDRTMSGPDHKASLEPLELAKMVKQIRELQLALGDGASARSLASEHSPPARQCVVAAHDIAAGAILSRDNLTTARSDGGLSANELWALVGTVASQTYATGESIKR